MRGCRSSLLRWWGMPKAVTEGVSGLLIPPRNAAALAGALERLLADPVLAKKLGENARKNLERLGREIDEIYG